MVNPISENSNRLIASKNDSPKHKDLSWEMSGSPRINVSLSEKTQEIKMFESDSLLAKVLKREFNEVFEFSGDKKDSFIKKLDHIFVNNRP